MHKIGLKGQFKVEHFDKDGNLVGVHDFPNGIVDAGIHHALDTVFDGGTPITTWYIGLINNAGYSALSNADTMASHSGWAEATGYSEATRPAWTPGAATGRAITNGTPVDFTINASQTIRGIFITSNNTKSGTSGTLWSTALFASNATVVNGDVLKITYTVAG